MKTVDDATNQSQLDLILGHFKNNPKRGVKHPEIVNWVVAEYKKRTFETNTQRTGEIKEEIQNLALRIP